MSEDPYVIRRIEQYMKPPTQVPCYECICAAICKNQNFTALVLKCYPIKEFYSNYGTRADSYYRYLAIREMFRRITW